MHSRNQGCAGSISRRATRRRLLRSKGGWALLPSMRSQNPMQHQQSVQRATANQLRRNPMTKRRAKIWTKGLSTTLLFFTALTISSAAFAMEPAKDPGRIDLRHLDLLLVQITMQDRAERETSRYRLNGNYILPSLERSHGWHGTVSRSNLLNSPAARIFTRVLTGRGGGNLH